MIVRVDVIAYHVNGLRDFGARPPTDYEREARKSTSSAYAVPPVETIQRWAWVENAAVATTTIKKENRVPAAYADVDSL
jgi:hypothetical protein